MSAVWAVALETPAESSIPVATTESHMEGVLYR